MQAIRDYVQQATPDQLQAEMGPGAADIDGIVPDIGAKLPGLPPPPALEPEQARFRLFDSITNFYKNAARSQPVVLVLDDLHWADEPSLLLLRFMAQQLQDSCILIIGCYRDVELSRQHPLSNTLAQLSREQGFQRHLLRGLSREETGQLVEAAAGIRPGPTVVDTVYTHTDGNPYFMTELVRLLVSQGELEEAGARASQGLRIPEGVREVIGQRLNRLSEQCNRMLTTASVIGREFRLDQLERLIDGLTDDQLLEALEEALEARLIEEMPQAPGRYQFAHRLAQETLTQELSLTRRVRLHARIATVLEELYGTNADANAAELAYHFAQAETVTGTD
ncbi:MAG: AAA family ATPase, partial [Chloroflexi bacterium]|nr:AAA family ATPase [Chloroflexota bacterium]